MSNSYEEMIENLDSSRFGDENYRNEVSKIVPEEYGWSKGYIMLNTYEEMLENLDFSRFGDENYRGLVSKIVPERYKWFQEEKGLKHWVLYDSEMFEVCQFEFDASLLFMNSVSIGLHLMEIELPLNASSCYMMLYQCILPSGFSLGDKFDTRNIVDMTYMFYECDFPEGFTLGNKFDTRNVEDMSSMFDCCCTLPKGFTLGDKFDTSKVQGMECMFRTCKIPEGFTLGNKFDTRNVLAMEDMFGDCTFPVDFTLGDKFDISKVKYTNAIFDNEEVEKKLLGQAKNLYNCRKELEKLISEGKSREEALSTLSEIYDSEVLDYFSGTKETKILSPEILASSLKETNSTEKTISILVSQGYSRNEVDILMLKAKQGISSSCYKALPKVLYKNGITVEEACKTLIEKGFPKEIVYECVCKYLGEQVLV